MTCSLLVVISGILVLESPPARADNLRLAAGEPGLAYDVLARALGVVLEHRGHTLIVTNTEGSGENIELLAAADVDFAICQADIAADGFRAHPGELAILGALFLEPLQILYPKDLNLAGLRDLVRRRVCIGEEGSGVFVNSRAILADFGISLADTLCLSPRMAANALIDNRIDAAITIAAAPSEHIAALLETGKFQLLSLPRPETSLLVKRRGYFKLMTIQQGLYEQQLLPVTTVGVRAHLLGRRETPDEWVSAILAALYLDLSSSRQAREIGPDIVPQISLLSGRDAKEFEMHPAAVTFFEDSRDHTVFALLVAHWQFIFFAIIPALLLMARRWLAARNSDLGRILAAVICLVIAWIVGSILLYVFEHALNDNFSDIMSSIWSTTTYLFSGFEEKYPFTAGGKIVSVLMIIFGLGVIAFVTGDISSILTKQRMEDGKVNNDQMAKHILVVNWNPRTDLILKQICECSTDKDTPVCVLSTEKIIMDDNVKKDRYRNRPVTWVVGDPLDKTYLKMVGAHVAKSVLILANEEAEDPDAFTALIGLAIHSLKVEEFKKQNHGSIEGLPRAPHVGAESLNHRKKVLMMDAHIDEVICSADYGVGILAQTVSSNHISRVYDRLLTFSENTNEVYFVREQDVGDDDLWRKTVVGKSFRELSEIFTKSRVPGFDPLILIGVKRSYRFFLNPSPLTPEEGMKEQDKTGDPKRNLMDDKFYLFDESDMLVFLSFERPRIRGYLENAVEPSEPAS